MLIGLDIGYSGLKVVYGDRDTPRRELILPVGVAPTELVGSNFMTGQSVGEQVLVDSTQYTAGIEPGTVPGQERTLDRNYTSTAAYKALFHAALVKAGDHHIHRLVTGLPVSLYLNEGTRKQVYRMLQGHHQVAPGREVVVESVRVVPQPAGTFIAYADSTQEAVDFLKGKTVLVIDPGFFSVDSVVLRNNQPYPGAATTSTSAMSAVLERADKAITREYEDDSAALGMYVGRMEEALRTGQSTIFVVGNPVEFLPYVERAAEVEAEHAIKAILRRMRHLDTNIDMVLLTGGGAQFYAPVVRDHFKRQRIVVVDNAPAANAHGFLSLARAYYHE